jgi:cytochrome c oxidase subunit 2
MRAPERRDLLIVGLMWLGWTIIAEWWAMGLRLHPRRASEEAEIVDGAFDLLLVLGLPVFVFVVVVLVYAVARFRARDEADGPAIRSDRRVVWTWVVVTSGLAVFVTINPGLVGMAELGADDTDPDLVIDVTSEQWNWSFDYVESGIRLEKADELVLPEGKRIVLRVTSTDVIHSLWIPAFRIKADAVPGRVHEVYLTPTETGDFRVDPNFRIQCAELCGTGHARMKTDVRVVGSDEFDAWVQAQVGA